MTRTIVPKPRPFGWCLDGNHAGCPAAYTNSFGDVRTCPCPHHDRAGMLPGAKSTKAT